MYNIAFAIHTFCYAHSSMWAARFCSTECKSASSGKICVAAEVSRSLRLMFAQWLPSSAPCCRDRHSRVPEFSNEASDKLIRLTFIFVLFFILFLQWDAYSCMCVVHCFTNCTTPIKHKALWPLRRWVSIVSSKWLSVKWCNEMLYNGLVCRVYS